MVKDRYTTPVIGDKIVGLYEPRRIVEVISFEEYQKLNYKDTTPIRFYKEDYPSDTVFFKWVSGPLLSDGIGWDDLKVTKFEFVEPIIKPYDPSQQPVDSEDI